MSPIAGTCTVTTPGAAVTSVPGTSLIRSASSSVRMRRLYALEASLWGPPRPRLRHALIGMARSELRIYRDKSV
ncbi:hypothetical protein GCM10010112_93290 [Actinoplanes lobatus]|nr:hypothetical protein GCM10010112_93290 [Actinoplanes lobatus]